MKRFIALTICLVAVMSLFSCSKKDESKENAQSSAIHSEIEPTPAPTPEIVWDDSDIEIVKTLKDPQISDGLGPSAPTLEKLLRLGKYAVYGTVSNVRDVKYVSENDIVFYLCVFDFAIEKDFSKEPIADKKITINLSDSSHKHDEAWYLFKKGDRALLIINDSEVDCHITKVVELAPYRIECAQCIFVENDGAIDITALNELLQSNGESSLPTPCTADDLGKFIEGHAELMTGESILSVYAEN